METRRIRRLERRRSRHAAAVTVAVGAIGVAVGLMFPRNDAASALILAVAFPILATTALRAGSFTCMHGLRRVVRLPMRSAISATLESYWSRVVGTTHSMWNRTSHATVIHWRRR
jgi:hypothetical protein